MLNSYMPNSETLINGGIQKICHFVKAYHNTKTGYPNGKTGVKL